MGCRFSKFLFLSLLGSSLFAQEYGTPLELATDSVGVAQVGIQYSYEIDWGWMLTYKTTLKSLQIDSLPKEIYWGIYNTQEKKLLVEWQPIESSALLVGQFKETRREKLRELLVHQKELAIVFSKMVGNSLYEYLYSLSIGEICEKHPKHVHNLTSELNATCFVDPLELED